MYIYIYIYTYDTHVYNIIHSVINLTYIYIYRCIDVYRDVTMSAAREITLHFEISGAPSGNPHLPTRNLAAGVGLARVKSSQFPDRFLTSKLATSA